MRETVLDSSPAWLSGDGPEADVVLFSQVCIARNLADFPFPARCSPDERRAVKERILGVAGSPGLFPDTDYWSLEDLSAAEAWLLAERELISAALVQGEGPRGALIPEDQCSSLTINEIDHLRTRALAPGLDPQSAWLRVNEFDEILGGSLDFSFHERRGYLTASLGTVGTGLQTTLTLHLPALAWTNKVFPTEQMVRESGHVLEGAFTTLDESGAPFFHLSNATTLGQSEEEIIFHLRQVALELVAKEREARDPLLTDGLTTAQDQVGRALGIARGAHLLSFEEAISLVSTLRFGLTADLLQGYDLPLLNELAIGARPGHISLRCDHACDGPMGSVQDEIIQQATRADLFRARLC